MAEAGIQVWGLRHSGINPERAAWWRQISEFYRRKEVLAEKGEFFNAVMKYCKKHSPPPEQITRRTLMFASFSTWYVSQLFRSHLFLFHDLHQFIAISPSFGLHNDSIDFLPRPLKKIIKNPARKPLLEARQQFEDLGNLEIPFFFILLRQDPLVNPWDAQAVINLLAGKTEVHTLVIDRKDHNPFNDRFGKKCRATVIAHIHAAIKGEPFPADPLPPELRLTKGPNPLLS
jgi:hypothetical protein